MSVLVVTTLAALAAYVPNLEELASATLETNAFYEWWMLLPSLKAFGAGKQFAFVLLFSPVKDKPNGQPALCGFFPLEIRRFQGLPIRMFSLWKHKHCFLSTPFVRAGYEAETLKAFFGWLATNEQGAALMEFRAISGEGPFQQALVDYLRASAKLSHVNESYTRAVFQPAADAETYIATALSGKHRKTIRRQERQLAEKGRLEYDALTAESDVAAWIKEFLELESSGWKGKEGGALASNEEERCYFETIATEAFRRGQLMMLALRLDGRPIASKCNFLTGRNSYTFKIAFDENYADYSPGVLLEVEHMRRLHAQSQTNWVDSCTGPNDWMFKRLWLSQRLIQDVIVGTGNAPGDLMVSTITLLKWLKRKLPLRKPVG